MKTILLQEAEVVSDIAIERETPVAFSNIKPLQIQEELGSQPIPMILNSTPGVYATQAGSDDNGPSISIRASNVTLVFLSMGYRLTIWRMEGCTGIIGLV